MMGRGKFQGKPDGSRQFSTPEEMHMISPLSHLCCHRRIQSSVKIFCVAMPTSNRKTIIDREDVIRAKAMNMKPLQRESGFANHNIFMGNPSPRPIVSPRSSLADADKENRFGLSLLLSPKNFNPTVKQEDAGQSLAAKLRESHEKARRMCAEKERAQALLKQQVNVTKSISKQLQQMQEKVEKTRVEMDKMLELLVEKNKMLELKDKETEKLVEERDKMKLELNRLRRLKEFKPTLNLPLVQEELKTTSQVKKPTSAYMMWRKDQWNKVKAENPKSQFKDFCNILSKKWKTLSAEEKKRYKDRHLVDKESYQQMMRKESVEKTLDLIGEKQVQKAAKELLEQYLVFKMEADSQSKAEKGGPLKPKQPLSAFFLFMNDRRPALLAEKKNAVEIAKISGEEWRNMNEEEQAPYKEIAKKLKHQYLQEMELYRKKDDEVNEGG